MYTQRSYPMREPMDVGEARRAAVSLAQALGFDETDQGRVAIVTTEAGTNVIKHGRARGEMIVGATQYEGRPAIEILALDAGPGMAEPARCMQDGYSTAGSPGTGLGAIQRLSTRFDLFSAPGQGTALLARVTPTRSSRAPASMLELGAVGLPVHGESVCGDGWAYREHADGAQLLVVDGLGHGPLAYEAARRAIEIFDEGRDDDPVRALERQHAALRSTRGAAGAITEARWGERKLRFCGIGNIAGFVITPQGSRGFASQNGTLGGDARTVRAFEYDWPARGVIVMHSDGLATRWDLGRYPGLLARDPSLIAAVLYRDFARGRDDVTVLVAKEREASP